MINNNPVNYNNELSSSNKNMIYNNTFCNSSSKHLKNKTQFDNISSSNSCSDYFANLNESSVSIDNSVVTLNNESNLLINNNDFTVDVNYISLNKLNSSNKNLKKDNSIRNQQLNKPEEINTKSKDKIINNSLKCKVKSLDISKEEIKNISIFLNSKENFEKNLFKVQNIKNILLTEKGSRIMQNKLDDITFNNINFLLSKIIDSIDEIIFSYFGNYFLQKFITTSLCYNQRVKLWESIIKKPFFNLNNANNFNSSDSSKDSNVNKNNNTNNNNFALDNTSLSQNINIIVSYVNNQYANHCIQALIDSSSSSKEELCIEKIIRPYYKDIAFNHYGNYVLQKMLSKFSKKTNKYLFSFLESNFIPLSKNKFGVCLIKKFVIVTANFNKNYKFSLINSIFNNIERLMKDSYGNFVIETMLHNWGLASCNKIIRQIENRLHHLASSKFSSTIIIKLIDFFSKVR